MDFQLETSNSNQSNLLNHWDKVQKWILSLILNFIWFCKIILM